MIVSEGLRLGNAMHLLDLHLGPRSVHLRPLSATTYHITMAQPFANYYITSQSELFKNILKGMERLQHELGSPVQTYALKTYDITKAQPFAITM